MKKWSEEDKGSEPLLRRARAKAFVSSLGLIFALSACDRPSSRPSERRLGEMQENGSSRGDGGRRVTLEPAVLENERAGQVETGVSSRTPSPEASHSVLR